jgi:dUTP pyrophosphatase
MKLNVKKLHPDAKLPTHGHPGDAAMDFYCLEDVRFSPGKQERVRTGVAIEIPEGHVGLIWDKSSLSFNLGLKVMGGVIDAGYRGGNNNESLECVGQGGAAYKGSQSRPNDNSEIRAL